METLISTEHILHSVNNIIAYAENYLYVVCPYPSFNQKTIAAMECLRNKPHVKLHFLFGKDSARGPFRMSHEDYDYLRSLPNVEIRYNSKLHSKYYGNEKYSITTSMNLNRVSNQKNLEIGNRFRSFMVEGPDQLGSLELFYQIKKEWIASEVSYNSQNKIQFIDRSRSMPFNFIRASVAQ